MINLQSGLKPIWDQLICSKKLNLTISVEHRTTKYLNNPMEADHRGIKSRYKPMKGFKSFESAARFCSAYDEVRNWFRYREFRNEQVSLQRRRTLYRSRFAYLQNLFKAA